MEPESLEACQKAIGYVFRNPFWLQKALTHSSNRKDLGISNERLEFLGDAVLGAIVAERLFEKYQDYTEGELTTIKSVVVSQRVLVRHSRALQLHRFLIVGPGMGEAKSLPRSVVANAFEALVAAIYLDGGLEPARAFVLDHLEDDIEEADENGQEENFKSHLQHLAQREFTCTPTYRVKQEAGPDHAKLFRVVTLIGGTEYGTGWGRNKKEAEQQSAKASLAMLRAASADEAPTAGAANAGPGGEPPPA